MSVQNRIIPDQGWSWVVLFACFFSMSIVDGIINSFGILYLELLNFGESRSATSWVGSLLPGLQGISGPLVSALIIKFGCRTMTILGSLISAVGFFCASFSTSIWMMCIFYGLFGGIGFSLMYISGFVMISKYFEKKRAFAMGLSSCGSGVGTFVFSPLSAKLMETFGWRGGLWVISAIVMNGAVCGSLYRPGIVVPTESSDDSEQSRENGAIPEKDCEKQAKVDSQPCNAREETHSLEFSLLLRPVFLTFCIATFMVFIGNFVPYIFLPDLARQHNIGSKRASFLPSIIGITNTAGRLICGAVSDRSWADPLKIFSFSLVACGIVTACVSMFHNFALLAFYAVVFGLCIGAYVSLFSVILIELLGLHSLSSALGFVSVFCGTAALSGAPLAGALFDIRKDYDMAFVVAGACICVAGIMMTTLRKIDQLKPSCTTGENEAIPKNCSREPFIPNGENHFDDLTACNSDSVKKEDNSVNGGTSDIALKGLKRESSTNSAVS